MITPKNIKIMKARILGIVVLVFVFIAGCGSNPDSGKSGDDKMNTEVEQTAGEVADSAGTEFQEAAEKIDKKVQEVDNALKEIE